MTQVGCRQGPLRPRGSGCYNRSTPTLAPGYHMNLLQSLLRRFRAKPVPAAAEGPRFAIHPVSEGVRRVVARGGIHQVIHATLELVRAHRGNLGLVMVEYESDDLLEWVDESLDRGRVLETLLSLRDLLGSGGFDVAIHTPYEGWELILDRFGILEIRAGSWQEPRLRSLFTEAGFCEVPRLSALPPDVDPLPWSRESWERFNRVRFALGLSAPDDATGSDR